MLPNQQPLIEEIDTLLPDKTSKKEEEFFSNDSKRNENLKDVFHVIFIVCLKGVFYFSMIILFIRGLHLILPEGGRWLCPEDLYKIDSLFTSIASGAIGAIFIKFFNKVA